ncbi:MAG: tripartite tricarboxylate transporter TctB family protein [Loktanella sp.]|nr:tripartite tricarboxylate transporter TctB family protein [Loktanella sp.]
MEDSPLKTLCSGVLFLTLSAVGWAALRQSENTYTGTPMPGDPGAFFLAHLCIGIVAVAAVVLTARGVWQCVMTGQRLMSPRYMVSASRDWALALGFVVSLLAMPEGMRWLGTPYAVAAFAIFWVFVLLTAVRGWSWRHLPEAALFGTGAALTVHLVFIRLLNLPLPV